MRSNALYFSAYSVTNVIIKLLVFLAIFLSLSIPAQSQDAKLEGAVLTVPVVALEDQFYRVELTVISEDPVDLQLTAGELLAAAASNNPSSFSNNTLHVPSLMFQEQEYWLDLQYLGGSPALFRLTDAGIVAGSDVSQGNSSIEDAMLRFSDFEDELSAFSSMSAVWEVAQEDPSNKMLCNESSESWETFQTGLADWSDYAFEFDVMRVSDNESDILEVYVRSAEGGAGYRASIANGNSAGVSYFPPYVSFGTETVNLDVNEWYTLRVEVVGNALKYFIDDELVIEVSDSTGAQGTVGVGVAPNTKICADNLKMWAIDRNGPIHRSNLPGSADPFDTRIKYAGDCPFCFVQSDENAAIWNQSAGGIVPRASDNREQIIIDENFVVNAGEEVLFEDKIVWVRPSTRKNIEVYGTLKIRNSLLIWDQSEHQQTRLVIENGGTLDIKDSYAQNGNQYWVNWEYQNGSTVILDNYVGEPWTTIHGSANYTARNYSSVRLTLNESLSNANITITEAHHVWLELFPPPGNYTMVFPEKFEWMNWEIANLWPNTTVSISDSYIYERDISLNKDVHVTITDTPSGFSLGWGITEYEGAFADCELRGLGDPNNDKGVFYENHIWDLPCNNASLTVVDSVLQRAWPNPFGNVRLRIYDSNLVDTRNYGGSIGSPTTLEIYDSTIDYLAAYLGGRVYIENSSVRHDIEIKDAGTVVYGYKLTHRDDTTEIPVTQVSGGQYVELTQPGPPWEN